MNTEKNLAAKIDENKTAPLLALENEKTLLTKMNWHGVSLKFANHYADRQSKDLGLHKSSKLAAIKAAQKYENFIKKKQLQEYDHLKQLTYLKRKKEKAKNTRLITLLESNKILEEIMIASAVTIQKIVRGFLVRKKYKDQLTQLIVKRLTANVECLGIMVEKCLRYLGEAGKKAAIIIQRNIRKFLAIRKFKIAKKLADERKAKMKLEKIVKIQSYVRKFLCLSGYRKLREARIQREKLEEIRKKLLVLRLKEFWHKKKFVWTTIQKKYKEESLASDEKEIVDFYDIVEIVRSNSKIGAYDRSRSASKHNTVITPKEQAVVPMPVGKPPVIPKNLALKYLQPTKSFISRTAKDEAITENTKNFKIRNIRGRRYQKDTNSRIIYVAELRNEILTKKRAVSADYRKVRSRRDSPVLSPVNITEFLNLDKEKLVNNKEREIDKKIQVTNLLLKKVEEPPNLISEETLEKVYVYNAPKMQSVSFKDALPDINSLLETYSKNLKKK